MGLEFPAMFVEKADFFEPTKVLRDSGSEAWKELIVMISSETCTGRKPTCNSRFKNSCSTALRRGFPMYG